MSSLRSGPAGAGLVLVVRTRQSDHRLHAGTSYRLGRDPGSDIVMSDARVSWHHAVLRHEQDTWIFEDAGSTNGTFVGTERVDRITISSDCVIRLGNAADGPILRCEPAARPVHAPTEISAPVGPGPGNEDRPGGRRGPAPPGRAPSLRPPPRCGPVRRAPSRCGPARRAPPGRPRRQRSWPGRCPRIWRTRERCPRRRGRPGPGSRANRLPAERGPAPDRGAAPAGTPPPDRPHLRQ